MIVIMSFYIAKVYSSNLERYLGTNAKASDIGVGLRRISKLDWLDY